jgi:hypothetical protein
MGSYAEVGDDSMYNQPEIKKYEADVNPGRESPAAAVSVSKYEPLNCAAREPTNVPVAPMVPMVGL